MYRRTSKYAKRHEWHPRPAAPEDEQRPAAWRPPKLRRRITIEDFDKVEIADTDDPDGNPYGWVGGTLLSHNLIGKRVRLLVVED